MMIPQICINVLQFQHGETIDEFKDRSDGPLAQKRADHCHTGSLGLDIFCRFHILVGTHEVFSNSLSIYHKDSTDKETEYQQNPFHFMIDFKQEDLLWPTYPLSLC